MIEAGKYNAKIFDWGLSETKGGDLQVYVSFEFKAGEKLEQMRWFGSLKAGKAIEITAANLDRMGFNGTDLTALAEGGPDDALNRDQEYEIELEPNTYNGKTSMRIKWINIPGSAPTFKKMAKQEVVSKLAGINFAGEMAAARAKTLGGAAKKTGTDDLVEDVGF